MNLTSYSFLNALYLLKVHDTHASYVSLQNVFSVLPDCNYRKKGTARCITSGPLTVSVEPTHIKIRLEGFSRLLTPTTVELVFSITKEDLAGKNRKINHKVMIEYTLWVDGEKVTLRGKETWVPQLNNYLPEYDENKELYTRDFKDLLLKLLAISKEATYVSYKSPVLH